MKESQFPLVRITLFFVLGICFAKYFNPNNTIVIALTLLSFSILFFNFFWSKKKLLQSSFFGIFASVTFFFIGILTWIAHDSTKNTNHYLHQISDIEKENIIELVVSEQLKSSVKNERFVATLLAVNQKKSFGKVLLNVRKNKLASKVQVGSNLKIVSTLYRNQKPKNPNQFDYGRYLENQQIYAQIYTDVSQVKIGSDVTKDLNYYANRLRTKIILNLEKNHFDKTDLAIVSALLLGQRQDISNEIMRDYQYAGAIHILSVSGLHVGFILIFITFLLKPIPNSKKGLIMKLVIIIASLWLFAIIAGLAPSVVRSVTMFSFVAIGIHLRRSVNIYNTLLTSILLILIFEPSFLFEVGFQLSYIAVFFIVWLQPLLSKIWKPKYKIMNYFWDIITVSFAAQIGTFPLSLYYFHQFPGLFFITNLIVLPMLSFILGIGIVVMLLAAFNIVWLPLLKLLEWSIELLNAIISWVASFEHFVIKNITFSILMMLSSYLIIFCFTIWFKKPNYKKLAIALFAVTLFQISFFQLKFSSQKEVEFIVFNQKKNTLITQRDGKKVVLYSNDSILKSSNENSTLKSYLVANDCMIQKKKYLSNFFYFNQKKIMILDNSGAYLENYEPDILILTQSPKINLERLFQSFKPQQVVVDASNYKSYTKRWKAICDKQKIPFHDTSEKGFYKL